MQFRLSYEAVQTTSHSLKFRHRILTGKPVATSPAPYYYIKKWKWRELHEPEVIDVLISTEPPAKSHFVYGEPEETRNFIRFRHQQKEAVRKSPVPYYYIRKWKWRELGEPQEIYVLVTPRLPELEED